MQLSLITLATLTSLVVAENNPEQVAAITGLYGDIKGHFSDYLSYIQGGHSLPNGLLNLYQEVQTYTDDSYTTLLGDVDYGSLENFAEGLPWYSSRLETYFAAATGEPESSAAASSSAPSSSEPASSEAASSAVSSITSVASQVESETPASSEASVSVYEGAASNNVFNGQSLVALVVPFVMVLAAPILI